MSEDLSGFSLFELFKSEAASHAQAISDGLLAVEADPDNQEQLERLMRAAHSIKGAARIIALEPVVELAHAMEDCFVAAQKGDERLAPDRIDQLLQGVDMLQGLAELPEEELSSWLDSQDSRCRSLGQIIRQPIPEPLDHAATSAETTTAPPSPPVPDVGAANGGELGSPVERAAPLPPTSGDSPAGAPDSSAAPRRTIPIGDANLNRIMRLAGEAMVDARRMQSTTGSLGAFRDVHREISATIEEISKKYSLNGDMDALRLLNGRFQQLLLDHTNELEVAVWQSERTSTALYYEVIGSRMRPFREGTIALPRMVRDLARALGKRVSLQIQGDSVAVDRDILVKLEAPLNHIIRNCVDHGIETPDQRRAAGKEETGTITVSARHHAGTLTIQVQDDGRGIDLGKLRRAAADRQLADATLVDELSAAELLDLLFLPGFTTAAQVTEYSGRGVGLDVVQSMVQEVSGTVRVETDPGRSTTFTMRLPVTLSVIRAVLAEVAGEPYAFPLARLNRIARIAVDACQPVQGKQQFSLDGRAVGLVSAADVFGQPQQAPPAAGELSVVVIGEAREVCGLVVDRFVGEQDLVVRRLDHRLGKVPNIAAAAVTEAGDPLLIVDIEDVLQSMQQQLGEGRLRGMGRVVSSSPRARRRVLVVDDSVTVREVERQLLQAHGFQVDVAVDGQDGWNALTSAPYDLLVTDIDMPRMNGIALIEALRRDARFAELPVIVVSYKAREEDRVRGLEAGADAYLTKGSFHDDSFMATVARLAGDVD